MAILTTENLSKVYGERPAVDAVNLVVNEGEIYGFVGRNGAGKTTLIRVLAGLAQKSSGSFSLFGIPDSDRAITDARKKVRVMVETPTLHTGLTAEQNMTIQCKLLGERPDCIHPILKEVELEDTGKKPVKNFSLGMRQRLAIAMSMIGEPKLLLLDEPTNGLDPEGIFHVRELLVKLNREHGVTILVSSHILTELAKFATSYGFIERGRLLKQIEAKQLNEECKNILRIKVVETELATKLLAERGYNFSMDINGIEIADATPPNEIFSYLTSSGVTVQGFENLGADLERYFLKLIGGAYESK